MVDKMKGNYVECPRCKAKKEKGAKNGTNGTYDQSKCTCPNCVGGLVHVSSIGSSTITDTDKEV